MESIIEVQDVTKSFKGPPYSGKSISLLRRGKFMESLGEMAPEKQC